MTFILISKTFHVFSWFDFYDIRFCSGKLFMIICSICKSNFLLVQTTGTFYAAARLSGATPPPAHVLSRSIGWQVTDR